MIEICLPVYLPSATWPGHSVELYVREIDTPYSIQKGQEVYLSDDEDMDLTHPVKWSHLKLNGVLKLHLEPIEVPSKTSYETGCDHIPWLYGEDIHDVLIKAGWEKRKASWNKS